MVSWGPAWVTPRFLDLRTGGQLGTRVSDAKCFYHRGQMRLRGNGNASQVHKFRCRNAEVQNQNCINNVSFAHLNQFSFSLVWAIVLKFILVFSQPARSSERRRSSDLQEEKVVTLCWEHLLFIRLPTFYTHFLEWCVCLFVCDVLSSLCTGKFIAIGRFLQSDKISNCSCPALPLY